MGPGWVPPGQAGFLSSTQTRPVGIHYRGVDRLDQAQHVGKASIVWASLAAEWDGTITWAFEHVSKNKVSYSTWSLTDTQAQYTFTHL